METTYYQVPYPKNPTITIQALQGHFATVNSHVSIYIDMSDLKFNANTAREVARELAIPYCSSTVVNTIVCMDRTEVIGAFLAEELTAQGTSVLNSGGEIHVVAPMINASGKLFFPESSLDLIKNKRIVLLVASVSGGRTLEGARECLDYYKGQLAGVSALFCSVEESSVLGDEASGLHALNALFTSQDIPWYRRYNAGDCAMCREGKKLDAIISSDGYSKITSKATRG